MDTRVDVRLRELGAEEETAAAEGGLIVRYSRRVRTLLLTNCDVYDDSPPQVLAPVIDGARKGTLVDDVLVLWLADKDKARAGLGTAYTNPANLTDEAIEVYLRPATTSPLRKAHMRKVDGPLRPGLPPLRGGRVPE